MCAAPVTFNTLHVLVWAQGEAELKRGENRIRADLKSALQPWGIE